MVDCESGTLRLGLAASLAAELRAEHVPVAEVSAAGLTSVVEHRVSPDAAPRHSSTVRPTTDQGAA